MKEIHVFKKVFYGKEKLHFCYKAKGENNKETNEYDSIELMAEHIKAETHHFHSTAPIVEAIVTISFSLPYAIESIAGNPSARLIRFTQEEEDTFWHFFNSEEEK